MNTVYAGLSVGALYVLVAVAYNMVFLATGVFNFAQAQFIMLGTFVAFTGLVTFHLPWPVVIIAGAGLGALVGLLEERVAIRPLQGLGFHGELVTTLGVAVLLDGLAVLIWGSLPLPVDFIGPQSAITFLTGRVYPAELALIGIGISVAIGAELYSSRTLLGITNLATSEDRVAARLRGINVERLSLFAFALAGAVCMGLGLFVAAKTSASPDLGDNLAIKGFVALAIGGFGSQKGALVGGLTAGLIEAGAARYLSADYQNASVFVLLLIVLMVRPTGLFGEREQRVV
jgi:branched-chain amino acid transport system permease protein